MIRYFNRFFHTFFLIASTILMSCAQPVDNIKPNFIIFIADDISWDDFGCYGNEIVQTPNIDRMASEGLKFTNVYLTTSSCSPSRISIMTGRYPHNTGAAELHTEPTFDFPTIASELRESGYYTGQAGKWHMGNKIKSGFDVVKENGKENGDGGEELWVSTLRNRDKNKPFFFWYAAIDAHRIWGPNEFSGTHNPDDIVPPVTLVNGMDTKHDLAKYYDEVKRFDHFIGRVEEELKNQDILDNTVIIIMSDNGRPFPRDKTRLYDSGIKTPFVVKWPNGMLDKNSVSNSLISVIDIAPTILDIANISSPPSFQGQSFKTIFKQPKKSIRQYVFTEHNWHDYEAHERMVRDSEYLYIRNSRPQFANQGPVDAVVSPSFKELAQNRSDGALTSSQADVFLFPRPAEELFDIKKDSLQLKNLIAEDDYKHIRIKLKNVLNKWMKETGDNIPKELTKDWYDRTSGKKIEENMNIRGEMPGTKNNAGNINKQEGF